jgi:F-type H+-transporting ATPase subunit delta
MAAVTSRYARALADVILESRLDAARAVSDMRAMVGIVGASADLRHVWESPAVPAEQKLGLLDGIVAKAGVSRPVRNFIAVLIDRHRLAALPEIARQFEAELDQRLGFAEAEVTTARELDGPEKAELEARLATVTGKKVRATYGRDPALLGGAIIKVGSTIYDGSVRGQLHRLKEQISNS